MGNSIKSIEEEIQRLTERIDEIEAHAHEPDDISIFLNMSPSTIAMRSQVQKHKNEMFIDYPLGFAGMTGIPVDEFTDLAGKFKSYMKGKSAKPQAALLEKLHEFEKAFFHCRTDAELISTMKSLALVDLLTGLRFDWNARERSAPDGLCEKDIDGNPCLIAMVDITGNILSPYNPVVKMAAHYIRHLERNGTSKMRQFTRCPTLFIEFIDGKFTAYLAIMRSRVHITDLTESLALSGHWMNDLNGALYAISRIVA